MSFGEWVFITHWTTPSNKIWRQGWFLIVIAPRKSFFRENNPVCATFVQLSGRNQVRIFPKSFEIRSNRQPDHFWKRHLRIPADLFEPQYRQMHMIGKAALGHWLPGGKEYAPDQDCNEEYYPPPGQSSDSPDAKRFAHKWQPFPEECSSQIHKLFLSSSQLSDNTHLLVKYLKLKLFRQHTGSAGSFLR